ncbi:MAG: universal stress protein, partial [Gammaproteobacteria bacterium]
RDETMKVEKILLIPSGNGADQPGIDRVSVFAGPGTEVEVFEPVFDSSLETYPLENSKDIDQLREGLVEEYRRRAGEMAGELSKRGLTASGIAAWDYPASDAIVRRALETEADLVVTESLSGRIGTLSQADWRLISRCPVPLLLVRSEAKPNYDRILAAVDPFHEHGKPPELDEAILDAAKFARDATDAKLEVIHCFVPLSSIAQGADLAHLPIDDAEESLAAYRHDALVELVENAGIPADAARIEKGYPARVLHALVGPGDIGLVIMGGLSRGRIRDFLLGSTAERLIHDSPADILIIKPPGFTTTVADHMTEPPIIAPIYYPF